MRNSACHCRWGMLFRKEFQPFRKRQSGMNERGQLMNNFSALLLFFPQCGVLTPMRLMRSGIMRWML
ncbi:hypothetical protein KCP77_21800 [Salmonella enterica subsp. enterica]|nr:hypothetical protein KCP77_21800 [Salmonella enterica subsp. enterica]